MSDEMKRELDGIKARLVAVEKRLGGEIGEVKTIVRSIAISVSRLTEKMDTNLQRTATKDDISRLNERLDGFAGKHKDIEFDLAKHQHRLDDYGRRIAKFEPRRA
jgi:hypothetical protein